MTEFEKEQFDMKFRILELWHEKNSQYWIMITAFGAAISFIIKTKIDYFRFDHITPILIMSALGIMFLVHWIRQSVIFNSIMKKEILNYNDLNWFSFNIEESYLVKFTRLIIIIYLCIITLYSFYKLTFSIFDEKDIILQDNVTVFIMLIVFVISFYIILRIDVWYENKLCDNEKIICNIDNKMRKYIVSIKETE